jgi:hypothetical protein
MIYSLRVITGQTWRPGTLFLLSFLIPFLSISAQSQIEASDSLRLKMYLDCWDCDSDYFRRNLQFVDFVRDPKLSDVHLLVTEQSTAS